MPTTNDNNPYNEELNHSAVAVIGDIVTQNAKQNSLNLLNNQIKLPPIIQRKPFINNQPLEEIKQTNAY
jgi:hypothetical protein